MPDCSPTKWHLAHVSWFFETFLLKPRVADYQSPNPAYAYLFNSYYNAIGDRYPRPERGHISRPSVAETYRYRAHVDEHVLDLLECADEHDLAAIAPIVTLGLHHEQQHQELILTDLKHMLSRNPLHPVYVERPPSPAQPVSPMRWLDVSGGHRLDRPRGRRLRFRQRRAPPPRICAALPPGLSAGDQCRVSRVHRRWWLPAARVLAVDGLGNRATGRLASTHLLAGTRRRVVGLSRCRACARSIRPSRCHTSATSKRMLTRAGQMRDYQRRRSGKWLRQACPSRAISRSAGAIHPAPAEAGQSELGLAQMFGDVWEWTAELVFALSRFSNSARRARGVQRQVHVQPVRVARRLVRHIAVAHPPDVSQLLPA